MMRKLLFAAAVMASQPMAVQAEEPGQSIVVQASGLHTPAGARRFRAALRNALDQVCGAYGSTEHDQWLAIDDCRAAAIQSVNAQLAANADRENVRLAVR